ncbi:MAG TPA: hypothetical protein VFD69_02265 [Vicinamibacterales bacterium]|nr:hypothetical protein [Vicinamibacterales bacterium]
MTRAQTAGVAALTALALGWLAAGLPAGAFFSGDSGVKLIATLEAIAHPARPFETDLPRIGERATTFVNPMVVPHGEHAHVLQSPLFPPLTAPLVAAFGLRGAYVWPALAFIALVPLLATARRHLLPDTSGPVLAWIAVAASPLLLYALEFWEHAPAVALLAAGTAAAAPVLAGGGSRARVALGGALVGAGVLLRPEGAWYAAGLALALGPRHWLPFAGGAAALLVPAALVNYLHFGNPLGAHASAVLAPIGADFLAARWQRVQDWLWPASDAEAAGLALVGAAWLAAPLTANVRARQLLALAGTAVIAVLAARRALPTPSFWQGFPLALLALVPGVTWTREARRVALAALVAVAGVVLTATNDGGAQWGTRYLLVAAPPLLLLAARGATGAAGDGAWRTPRLVALAVILLAGAATSRSAYLELRGAKRDYEGLVVAVAAVAPAGSVIVTNLWWLDQIAAALHGTRVFLYVPDGHAAARALATLRAERIDAVTLAWSADGAESPFALDAALDGTCFRTTAIRDAKLRSMRFAAARCAAD